MEDERHRNGANVANNSGVHASSSSDTDNYNTDNNNSNINNNNNREHDRFLPIANVGRIMKKTIPSNGKISKDAKETVQECVSEFISFVTGEASDKCQREKRKTINGDDVIWAITTLGFENYVSPLKQYLLKYRELEGEKLHLPKQQQQQQQQQQPPPPQRSEQQNMSYGNDCLVSPQQSFVAVDQKFPFPFPPASYQNQLQQQNHMDSLGPW